MPKYEKSADGMYHCHQKGCDDNGGKGWNSPVAFATHNRWKHDPQALAKYREIRASNKAKREGATPAPKRLGRPPKVQALAKVNGNHKPVQRQPAAARHSRPLDIPAIQTEADDAVNHCPRCGCNLSAIKDATGGAPAVRCPSCRLPLIPIRQAMRPEFVNADPSALEHVFGTVVNILSRH